MTKRLYAMETLDDLLLKVVDETLRQVFGETVNAHRRKAGETTNS